MDKLAENGHWEEDGQEGMEFKFGIFQIDFQAQSWLVVSDSKLEFRCQSSLVFAFAILNY